jgi:histidine phosphotransferase ChpT
MSDTPSIPVPSEPAGQAAAPQKPVAAELAAHVAAKVCHDLISPVSAIVSGLDLLEDDDSQDMREDAMNLIAASARKLAAALTFSRVAFGASASADTFDPRELEKLTRGVYDYVRAELDWAVDAASLNKPAARALLNIAQIGAQALPTGGAARVTAAVRDETFVITLEARGPRARLRPETVQGLKGLPLSEGMAGQWVQAYYLHELVAAAGGSLTAEVQDELVSAEIRLPL